ncbi:uncharacterized protein Z518_05014 [Rhinocladiella mackenziei CBS 650.93]|uniref:Aminotransferase class I/classII large domain-containing protein n=1 Tax=Rhinocladiella mackenziei CBS 650.93 TaxID=1442369 RepID=A0A0D2FXM4_9EURO|nr:uncharacterized protein Z518_05014 [Rhinocladiella mackenziei CBS 650.93]KIX07037.1 hypothetical protein Z518_05014 [Rhinocladiella mackenziei CBS 650.93]
MVSPMPQGLIERNENYHKSAKHDLLASSASIISIADLLDISENRTVSEEQLALTKIILEENEDNQGNIELRTNLAALYSARSAGVAPEDIVITNGAAAANYTVFASLLAPGDHVIVQHPVDELLYKVPRLLGADVTLWEANPSKRWRLDTDELRNLIKENTSFIVIHSPCDPTGAIVPKPTLEILLKIAEEKGIVIVADETYRPLFHSILPSSEDFPPSTINLGHQKVVVTGAVGKAYSLVGIKVGWIASKDKEIIDACKRSRRYTSMTGSKLDEAVAAEALSDRCIHALLSRNIRLCQTNLELLQAFIEEHGWACSWVKPLAGTTAMIKFHKMGKPVDDNAFCLKLFEKAGLLVCPASKCFGESLQYRGYVRVAFGGSTSQMKAALAAWSVFMEESYESVPAMSNT